MKRLSITRSALETCIDAARRQFPLEACGILTGRGRTASDVAEIANVAADPRRAFVLHAGQWLEALSRSRAANRHWIGVFHSHPSGTAEPSATDRRFWQNDGLTHWIVGWRPGQEASVCAYAVNGDRLVPIDYAIMEEEPE